MKIVNERHDDSKRLDALPAGSVFSSDKITYIKGSTHWINAPTSKYTIEVTSLTTGSPQSLAADLQVTEHSAATLYLNT